MANKGWKHKPKTKLVVGTETNPTKLESGQVVINKKATKQNLDRLIEINNNGLDKPIKKEVTTDGTEGGLLKGKPHYDKNGNSLGGIPAVVDGAKNIETEGEEFLLNKEASQKHWKELSKINQSAGNGVPINPSDVGSDEDPQEFRKGGTAKIIFNPNHIPNKWIYSYAKKIKENYPKVWDMGGNIFGNEAFKNLERVIKRGYWTDNEEWMYIKWQSFVARHHKDFRIAGTVAMLKWVDKTDKGWDYMKALIDKEVAKKYAKKGFKRKLLGGGGVGKIFELTTYFITADSQTDSDIIYKGLDFEDAKKEFKNADYDFNSGGIIIFNKKTDKYKFVGDLENGEYEISDFPLEEYYKDKNYYKLIEEGDFDSIDSKDIEPINKKADELLTKVYNHFGKKYNVIWLDKDETISLNLRIADHSGKWKNKGSNDYFLSIVVSDKNPTEKFYKSSPEGLKRDEEEVFGSDATFEEIIDFINNKIKDFQENEDITNYKVKYNKGGGIDNKFQKNLDELLKEEGWNVSYYDKNINNVPKEQAYQISLSKFDPYYENITIKLPSKMEVTFEWVMNKINKDKVYKSFSENFNKILKSKGLANINAYPTTYGIGIFVFAGTKIPETKKNIENLLNSLEINYNTEYSDANYVFRYKISKSKENIEKIKQLEIKMAEGGGVEFIPEKKGTLIRGNEIIKYFEKVNGNYRLMFYTLNETKGKVPTICDAFGYCEELDIMNITPKELVELIKKNNLMEYGGELAKGIKAEKEHIDTAKKLYNQKITPNEAARSIAMEHIKEDPKYYSKMETIDFDKHYDEIKTKYADGGNLEPTYTLNTPSGDKSRLTYLQQVLVRTTAFKNFFGDWETAAKNYLADNRDNYKQHFENVSKVMDMSILEPRVVYHGTKTEKEFFMFDVSKEKGQGRPYAYFAENIEYSKNFTDFSQRGHSNSQALLYECFLNVRNPFRALGDRYETKRKEYDYWLTTIIGTIALDKYDTIEKNTKTKNLESAVNSQIEKYLKDSATDTSVPFWYYMARDTNSEFKYFLLAYGYDGIFYGEEYATDYDVTNPKEYTHAVCIFTANDIKLADGRNLNFDPMNADIRYEKGGVPEQKAPTEHALNKKEALGNLLFGEKYAKGGTTSKSNEDANPMFEKKPDNNRKFVDELIKKMKQ